MDSGFLDGLRVVELADELGEYCGSVLARLGADVIKVEPPGGEVTRGYGPFYQDVPHPDRSLHFWHYNLAKKSVVLDLDDARGQADFRGLVAAADVLVDTRPRDYLTERGLGGDRLRADNPRLVYARLSPFGDDGPWADLRGGDLVHLALGGVMMNCGYSPDTSGRYDTPPIAPQMWQSYHIAGEVTVMAILGALCYRDRAGVGQQVSTSVHEAVSKCTETDLPSWIYLRRTHHRQTCRHSLPGVGVAVPSLAMTKDGRWLMPYNTYLPGADDGFDGLVDLLREHDMADDVAAPAFDDRGYRLSERGRRQVHAAVSALVLRLKSDRELWRDAQERGLPWAPLRTPEENLADPHWAQRETFAMVHHPELGRSFRYVTSRWVAPGVPARLAPRPPLLGEHTAEVLAALPTPAPAPPPPASSAPGTPPRRSLSAHGRPFALDGTRVVDLGWVLASAGAGRFLAALGAEVIKVEHVSRMDIMRYGAGMAPAGGRAARDAATTEIEPAPAETPNRCGAFMEINAGKRGLSLNLKDERGKELLRRLIADADVLIEGYSPGTLQRMGFGWDALRALNPRLVYVQQSGMGEAGRYGRLRSFGPTAQAFSGLSEMSGLPSPYPPAGIGYSYLDWFGAYNVAVAALAGLRRRERTGEGCHIDSSQTEIGLFLTGTAVLDFTVNGRGWSRVGNRSPWKPAAPCGAYPTRGEDRWVALSCFDDDQWAGMVKVLGDPEWAGEERFQTLAGRLAAQDELDELIATLTRGWDRYRLMDALQAAGVPAGVCQTAEDRCEIDPQLRHHRWLVDLPQSEIGTWPVREAPFRLSETPPYMGGPVGRSGPNYGEDTHWVLSELLGLDDQAIGHLHAEGVV